MNYDIFRSTTRLQTVLLHSVVVVVPRGRKVGGVSRAVFVPFGFIARDVSLEIRRVVAVVNRRVLLWLVTTGRRGIVVRGQLRVP